MAENAFRYLLPRRPVVASDAAEPLTSRDYFVRLRQLIETAQRSLLLEFYIFRSDETGYEIADLLAAAKARGVRVCLIYDSFGAWGDSESALDFLIERGVEVIEFHPLFFRRRHWWSRTLLRRDHRKLVVADSRWALIGSGNIGDEYRDRQESDFYDLALAISGPVATEIEKEFWRVWKKHGGQRAARLTSDRGLDRERQAPAQVLANRERTARRIIESAYVHAIEQARQSIYIANAYFVPNMRLRRSLIAAVRRGVDVRLLVPAESNRHLVHLAGAYVFGRLLKTGVRIFEWRASVLHAKYGVVDAAWTIVGSYNFDAFSLRRNLEVAVAIESGAVAQSLQKQIREDLDKARELSYADWQSLPWSRRLLQWIAHKLSNWL